MANKILHSTIMQKNTSGGKNIIYPKTVTKNIIDGSSTLDQTLNILKSPDVSNKTITFTEADTRENLVSGESLATSHGKIMKLIADLKSLAYLDTVGVSNLDSTLTTAYNNRVTTDKVTTSTTITSAGYIADARAVNNLQNQINTVDNNIQQNYFRLFNGTALHDTDDLNNIMDIGNYYCELDLTAQTIKNTPFKNAFTLKVFCTNGTNKNYICQEIIGVYSWVGKYVRYYDGYYQIWSEWDKCVTSSDFTNKIVDSGNILEYCLQQNNTQSFITTPDVNGFPSAAYWSCTIKVHHTARVLEATNGTGVKYLNWWTGSEWVGWSSYVTKNDLQWEVITHNTEPSYHQVDGKTLFKVEYTMNKQIVGFAPMQPNLIIHGIYRNSAEIDYLIVTNSSGENIPNIEINVKVLFANFS